MSPENLPVLYVKTGCARCRDVIDFLRNQGVSYHERSVTSPSDAVAEAQPKCGKINIPTLDWYGTILADFGVEELKEFLLERHVRLEDS